MVDVLVSADVEHEGGRWVVTAHLGGGIYGSGTFEADAATEQDATDLFMQRWAAAYPPPDGQDPAEWVPANFQFTSI